MCNNYKPSEIDLIRSLYRVDSAGEDEYPRETWPDYAAPIVRNTADGGRECVLANFGFVPKRRQPAGVSFDTTNARSETVGQKRTFAKYWHAAQLCLVPAQSLFEPCYEADQEPPAEPAAIRIGENGLRAGTSGSALARGGGASAGTGADTVSALDS